MRIIMLRERVSMNKGWRFYEGEIEGVRNRWGWGKSGSWNQGPESFDYDDSGWGEVELPHDFVIESTPFEYSVQEFGSDNAIPEMDTVKNIHTTAGSFKKDVGWYRKHFFVGEEDLGKRIHIAFDGVYRDSTVYVNNFFVGKHQSGYTPFEYDISDFLNYGGDNVIVVYVDARKAEGWFYEGGGIYRNVWLYRTAPVYVSDVFVKAVPDIEKERADSENITARLDIAIEISSCEYVQDGGKIDFVKNDSPAVCEPCDYSIEIEIDGDEPMHLSSTLEKLNYGINKYRLTADMDIVKLWDIESPFMYNAQIRLYKGGECIDCCIQDFGVRKIFFDADEGFMLNGRRLKLNGVCCHQNHGGVGAAMTSELYHYRLLKLKDMGVNAYRTSHYCPAPELLYWCDRLGILVMDETRLLSSAGEDLDQLEAVVRNGRNHPSVIMYSIGNEEAQSELIEQGGYIAGTMIKHIRSLDDTRPVTMGLLLYDLQKRRKLDSVAEIEHIGTLLDVCGFNYHHIRWQEYKDRHQEQPIICSEASTIKGSRECYRRDEKNCLLELSMMETVEEQTEYVDRDYISGAFLWTGFDYYGEPTPFAWPAVSSQFGLMDLSGNPKDGYYYFRALYRKEPLIHIACSWSGEKGDKKEVIVFANCQQAELFVNGKSLGRKAKSRYGYLRWEDVSYEEGTLSAVGDDGTCEDRLVTAGSPDRIKLGLEYRENNIIIVNAAIVDEDGNTVCGADCDLHFDAVIACGVAEDDAHVSISCEAQNGMRAVLDVTEIGNMGGGRENPPKIRLLGTSSGWAADHVTPHSSVRRSFNGMAQAIFSLL